MKKTNPFYAPHQAMVAVLKEQLSALSTPATQTELTALTRNLSSHIKTLAKLVDHAGFDDLVKTGETPVPGLCGPSMLITIAAKLTAELAAEEEAIMDAIDEKEDADERHGTAGPDR